MEDGESTIDLGPVLGERLKAFGAAADANVEAVVRNAVAVYLDDRSETLMRLARYDRDRKSGGAEEVLGRFQDAVASRAKSLA